MITPASRPESATDPADTASLFLLANRRTLYPTDGGFAATGSLRRKRLMSFSNSVAVPAPIDRDDEADILPLDVMERQAIIQAINACGSAAQAARRLGISEATIYRRIRKYNLEVDEV